MSRYVLRPPLLVEEREPQPSRAQLLPELLLQIFALLAPTPFTLAAEDELDRWQMPLRQANIVRLMFVCKVWRSAAEHIFYRAVNLKDPKACMRFARTLKRRPALGALVRIIYFPNQLLQSIRRPIHHQFQQNSKVCRYFCKRNQQRLGQATLSILDICTRVDVVKLHADAELLRSQHRGYSHQSRIRVCTVELQWPGYSCYFTELTEAVLLDLCSTESNPYWEQLEVLRVYGYGSQPGPMRMGYLLPVLVHRPTDIGRCFPNLQTLVLKDILLSKQQLEAILLALAPKLRTLGLIRTALCDNRPMWGQDSHHHPLAVLDSLPPNMLYDTEDIRLDYCTGYEPWPDCSRERAFDRWCNVARLSLSTELLQFFKFVPPTLKSINIYELASWHRRSRPLKTLLDVVNVLVWAMPTWKTTAPGLSQVGLEARNISLDELQTWRIISLILRESLQRHNISVIVNVA
ncbi:hypothetical protein BKA62DRAFT_308668 [Auriculariales sp. MPI-PUGE-AT-0066]|nr:hypothetical protein BKA62DRAFT_308668 [Auriculariales sp. MPI-PUGE-AT-0066]